MTYEASASCRMSWMGQARKLRMVWYTILYVLARADMFLVFARRETLCFDPPLQTKEAQRIARTYIVLTMQHSSRKK